MKNILKKGYVCPVSVGKENPSNEKGGAFIFVNKEGKLYVIPENVRDGWKALFDFLIAPTGFEVKPSSPEYGCVAIDLSRAGTFIQNALIYNSGNEKKGIHVDIGNHDWFFYNLWVPAEKSIRLVDEGDQVTVYRF